MMLATVVQVGDDLAIQFPPELSRRPGFEVGATVNLHSDGERFLLSTNAVPPAGYEVKPGADGAKQTPPVEGEARLG